MYVRPGLLTIHKKLVGGKYLQRDMGLLTADLTPLNWDPIEIIFEVKSDLQRISWQALIAGEAGRVRDERNDYKTIISQD